MGNSPPLFLGEETDARGYRSLHLCVLNIVFADHNYQSLPPPKSSLCYLRGDGIRVGDVIEVITTLE